MSGGDAPPVGARLDWAPPPLPSREPLRGTRVTLVPLAPASHAAPLFDAAEGAGSDPHLWRYMSVGPFGDVGSFRAWVETAVASDDPLFYAIVDGDSGKAAGMASYLRMTPAMGTIEIGNIWFGGSLQRTRGATEAIYLLARNAFDLGYRRLEWKCDALNERSRRAADRFGFAYEGVFRQHMVIKGRNRDTAWYAIVDADWPAIGQAFERWLDPANFDDDGRQRRSLAELRGGTVSETT